VAELLDGLGAVVTAIDPHLEGLPGHLTDVELISSAAADFASFDAVVVLTDHDRIDYDALGREASCILDTRHRLAPGVNVEYL
jgi:UDP-N-acetyl-D-glucosamine dehydrogenase